MDKILVIGEICTDEFIYGDVPRICPESPVPIFVPKERRENLGMGGNVVNNLKSIDKNCEVIHWHQAVPIRKTRLVEKKSNQMLVRIDEGDDKCDSIQHLSIPMIKAIGDSDIVIISDYHKGFLSDDNIMEISKYSKLTILDSKRPLSEKLISNIDFIKLNKHEWEKNYKIVELYKDKFFITLGYEGVKHLDKIYPSPRPLETIDVSGAGDTFVAAFTIKYLETKTISTSLEFANEMASIVVAKKGVSTPF